MRGAGVCSLRISSCFRFCEIQRGRVCPQQRGEGGVRSPANTLRFFPFKISLGDSIHRASILASGVQLPAQYLESVSRGLIGFEFGNHPNRIPHLSSDSLLYAQHNDRVTSRAKGNIHNSGTIFESTVTIKRQRYSSEGNVHGRCLRRRRSPRRSNTAAGSVGTDWKTTHLSARLSKTVRAPAPVSRAS